MTHSQIIERLHPVVAELSVADLKEPGSVSSVTGSVSSVTTLLQIFELSHSLTQFSKFGSSLQSASHLPDRKSSFQSR